MEKKYELTSETNVVSGKTLYRIKALIDFSIVKAGDLGGFVEEEANLSQEGNAWVSGNARVYGDAWVSGNARVYGNAWVSGNARVYGNAWVYGNARVYGNAWVSDDARVYGDARVSDDADLIWFSKVGSENGTLTACKSENGIWVSRGCFSGTLEEFESAVEKTHGDSQIGKEYKLLIEFIRLRLGASQ